MTGGVCVRAGRPPAGPEGRRRDHEEAPQPPAPAPVRPGFENAASAPFSLGCCVRAGRSPVLCIHRTASPRGGPGSRHPWAPAPAPLLLAGRLRLNHAPPLFVSGSLRRTGDLGSPPLPRRRGWAAGLTAECEGRLPCDPSPSRGLPVVPPTSSQGFLQPHLAPFIAQLPPWPQPGKKAWLEAASSKKTLIHSTGRTQKAGPRRDRTPGGQRGNGMWGIKSNDSVRGRVQVPTSSAPRNTLQPFHKCLSVCVKFQALS